MFLFNKRRNWLPGLQHPGAESEEASFSLDESIASINAAFLGMRIAPFKPFAEINPLDEYEILLADSSATRQFRVPNHGFSIMWSNRSFFKRIDGVVCWLPHHAIDLVIKQGGSAWDVICLAMAYENPRISPLEMCMIWRKTRHLPALDTRRMSVAKLRFR